MPGSLLPTWTDASWALPITLAARSFSSSRRISARNASRSVQVASRPGSSQAGLGSGHSARWTCGRFARLRHELPEFLGRMWDDRRQQAHRRVVEPAQDELRGAAVGAIGLLGIEPILEDIEIKARQLDGRRGRAVEERLSSRAS